MAKLVGRSEKLSGERLDLLRLPEEAQALLAARKLPLACAPALIRIAEREPLLADLTAVWLSERPQSAAGFTVDPGEVVDDVLEAEWQDDDGQPLHPVAYTSAAGTARFVPAVATGRSSSRASCAKTLRARRGDGRAAAHPSGVNIWLNDPKNRALVARADEPIRGELVAVLDLE